MMTPDTDPKGYSVGFFGSLRHLFIYLYLDIYIRLVLSVVIPK